MNANIYDIYELNSLYKSDPVGFISSVEANYHSQMKQIAEHIINSDKRRDVLLISGPSSSGKSTTANIIRNHITAAGMDSIAMSTDDFFFNRDELNASKLGYDFESPTIVNELLLIDKINELLTHGEAYIPTFDFVSGKKIYETKKKKLAEDGVIIIEGIHALNKDVIELSRKIDATRVYVSTVSGIKAGDVVISGRDMRLTRRILRDIKFRGTSMEETLDRWENVCAGETKYIAPHMNTANYIVDTFLPYEPLMMRNSMLEIFGGDHGKYADDPRIKQFEFIYNACIDGDESLVPTESLIREFIGGGIYG